MGRDIPGIDGRLCPPPDRLKARRRGGSVMLLNIGWRSAPQPVFYESINSFFSGGWRPTSIIAAGCRSKNDSIRSD
jgi:hypothetical protein